MEVVPCNALLGAPCSAWVAALHAVLGMMPACSLRLHTPPLRAGRGGGPASDHTYRRPAGTDLVQVRGVIQCASFHRCVQVVAAVLLRTECVYGTDLLQVLQSEPRLRNPVTALR